MTESYLYLIISLLCACSPDEKYKPENFAVTSMMGRYKVVSYLVNLCNDKYIKLKQINAEYTEVINKRKVRKKIKSFKALNKIVNSHDFSSDELRDVYNSLSFSLEIDKKRLEKFVDDTISLFINDELVSTGSANCLKYEAQKEAFRKYIQDIRDKYNFDNLSIREKDIFGDSYQSEGDFLFLMLALEKEDLIEIKKIYVMPKDVTGNPLVGSSLLKISDGYIYCIIKINKELKYVKEEEKKQNKKMFYRFKEYNVPEGVLKIGDFPEITFLGTRAMIINFFYSINDIDVDYKNYKDYNDFIQEKYQGISSNDFRLRINKINSRVKKTTKGLVKQIIIQDKNKRVKANIYKWNENIK